MTTTGNTRCVEECDEVPQFKECKCCGETCHIDFLDNDGYCSVCAAEEEAKDV